MKNKKEEKVVNNIEEVKKRLFKPLPWYCFIWCRILKIPRILHELDMFPRRIYWFFQRGKRGYADEDTWQFCDYLSEVICGGLKQLKKYKHGIPSTINPKTGKYSYNERRWNKILAKMIYTFETSKKILNNYPDSDWLYIPTDEWDEKKDLRDKFKDGKLERVMTKKECLAYEEGWKLFAKYFYNLWD